jgi:hypothetical protein
MAAGKKVPLAAPNPSYAATSQGCQFAVAIEVRLIPVPGSVAETTPTDGSPAILIHPDTGLEAAEKLKLVVCAIRQLDADKVDSRMNRSPRIILFKEEVL